MSFKILSIDGGGIRGVFPAQILKCVHERLNISILDNIDMICGTSTGSIVAAAIACNISPDKILELYQEKGKKIFPRDFALLPKILKTTFVSLYRNKTLYNALSENFHDIKLGDINIPLIIPATDIGNGIVHVFKSSYSPDFTRDKNRFIKDAVMASCSAPTFFDPTKVDNYLLADGGLWANNPALVAIIDAQKRLNINIDDIQILSIGTGQSKKCYGANGKKRWGLLSGWEGKELVNFFMSLQSQTILNYLNLSLKESQILRLDFETDLRLSLDDYRITDDLISRADSAFTYNSTNIMQFFNN